MLQTMRYEELITLRIEGKNKQGHITLSRPPIQWYDSAIAGSGFKKIPISSKISNIAVNLKWEHKDPADRWIVATAISEGASLC